MRIIYFDGVCNLCNGFVDFIIERDPEHKFHFASLQGRTARERLRQQDLGLDSVILSDDGKIFKKSKAVLMILNGLGPFFKIVSMIGNILPIQFTDFAYDFIAKYRYTFFGQKNSCRIPTAAEKSYFLD